MKAGFFIAVEIFPDFLVKKLFKLYPTTKVTKVFILKRLSSLK